MELVMMMMVLTMMMMMMMMMMLTMTMMITMITMITMVAFGSTKQVNKEGWCAAGVKMWGSMIALAAARGQKILLNIFEPRDENNDV